MFRLMVAGGGTGGHLFPGVAVAEEFLRRDPDSRVLFVGTGRPVEAEVLNRRGLPSRTISAAGLKGKSLWQRLRSMAMLPMSLFQAVGAIREFRPDLVFGVGGYVAGPLGVAARLLGVPSAIHEQNSVPGMTNKLLGRLADLVFISFESSRAFFPADRTHLTGNPIRREIAAAAEQEKMFDPERFVLLAAGGSQGAHAVNMAVVEAMPLLQGRIPGLEVIHQTGGPDEAMVRENYEQMGIRADVQAFMTDMERAYTAADLAVCRAGALTVAEIAATGTAAVFIPLPTAADNHQEINAKSLVDAGGAVMMLQKDVTPQTLADTVSTLASDRETLRAMSRAARKAALPDAAGKICDLTVAYLERRGKKQRV